VYYVLTDKINAYIRIRIRIQRMRILTSFITKLLRMMTKERSSTFEIKV